MRAVPEKRCVLILREIPKNTPEKVRVFVWCMCVWEGDLPV